MIVIYMTLTDLMTLTDPMTFTDLMTCKHPDTATIENVKYPYSPITGAGCYVVTIGVELDTLQIENKTCKNKSITKQFF